MSQFISSVDRIARKEHTCDYCALKVSIGELYTISTYRGDDIYIWKSHISCYVIASKLNWFDAFDEGLTGEDFRETVRCEYDRVMSETLNEQYESKDFKIPSFSDQLKFIKDHHKID